MTTKPPSSVSEHPGDSFEKIAYTSVSGIPTEEPNDRNRLGYHVWRWLTIKQGTLEGAIRESGCRMKIARGEALEIISRELEKQGIKVR